MASPRDQQAREWFEATALTQLAEIDRKQAAGLDLGLTSLTHSYQARLRAFRDGWDGPQAHDDLARVLSTKIVANRRGHDGYARGDAWDAYGDHTVNSADTIYAVTLADHVGPTILAAAGHGALPESEVYFIVDALMALPVMSTPYGEAMAYSDSPYDAGLAVVNTSIGAAAFLQTALEAGFSRSGQQQLIDRLEPFATRTYAAVVEHWWPYMYSTRPDYKDKGVGFPRDPAEQDWNHEAYTAESAAALGLPVGEAALDHHLHFPGYDPLGKPVTEKQGRDVMGRLRMEYLRPGYNPRNTVTDAAWFLATWGDDARFRGSENAQLGWWCARLAENADALSLRDFGVGTIDPATASHTQAAPGTPVTVSTVVRNHQGVGIVDKAVELHLAGAHSGLLRTGRTGLRGDVQFTEPMPDHEVCYRVVAADGVASQRVCVAPD